jgi:hypothetical protein
MSTHAIFVDFTPKLKKLTRPVPKLWGKLRPLEETQGPVREDESTPEVVIEEYPTVAITPSYHLRLVANSGTHTAKPSAIYIDLDDYQ